MTEYTLKLDPETHDLVFDESGVMVTVEGDEATAQNVAVTLGTWEGEFLLDRTHGTPYQRVLGQDNAQVMEGDAEAVIREGILQEPGVVIIKEISAEIAGRTLLASFTGELAGGSEIVMEGVEQRG